MLVPFVSVVVLFGVVFSWQIGLFVWFGVCLYGLGLSVGLVGWFISLPVHWFVRLFVVFASVFVAAQHGKGKTQGAPRP